MGTDLDVMLTDEQVALSHFERIARELASDGVRQGVAHYHRALKRDGRAFLCLERDGLVIRLPDDSAERVDALGVEGAHLLEVGGGAITLDEWIVLPAMSADRWDGWARAAVRAVSGPSLR